MLAALTAGLMIALLTGCSLSPDYQRPDAPIAPQWPSQPLLVDGAAASADRISWRDLFADPKLRRLVDMALENNRDLRIAALNIERTRAQYRIQRAELVPQIGINGTETAQRTPGSLSTAGIGGVSHAYGLNVGVSTYELDLFGRLRSLNEEALQTFLATEETRRATHISLIADVASRYLALAADRDLVRLAQDTLASRQRSYDLQAERNRVGNLSVVELRQAETELEAARADALTADNQIANDRNALELLVGTPLLPNLLPGEGSLTAMLGIREIPPGLPSDLLRQRPDILAAEHTLIGANANIGAARAAFFPSISLTADIGRASNELSGLFDHGGRSWNFAPQITLPIFSGGRLQAQLEVSKADRDIALAQYEQAIQSAFRDVADALAQRSVVQGQVAAQRKRADAAQAAYGLVSARYENGVTGYLDVLDAQRSLYAAQQTLIQTELSQQTSLVTLYKALGGGWSEPPENDRARTGEPDDANDSKARSPDFL